MNIRTRCSRRNVLTNLMHSLTPKPAQASEEPDLFFCIRPEAIRRPQRISKGFCPQRREILQLLPQDGPRGLPHHVADTRLQRDPSGNLHNTDTGRDRASDETAPSARSSAQRSSTTMSLPSCPGAGYELIEGHRCASTAGFVEPFNFAAVGARQPTSRARVLEVRI